MNDNDKQESFAVRVRQICDELCELLIDKNQKYGDSAMHPVRIFSQADADEQIRVRIDDKLSRLAKGEGTEDEDVIKDLLGYLVILRMHIQDAEYSNELLENVEKINNQKLPEPDINNWKHRGRNFTGSWPHQV